MKSKVLFFVLAAILLYANFAEGLIFIEDGYFEVITLNGYEELLMTGGGHRLNLNDYSKARIQGTDPLIDEYSGGIWELSMAGYSYLNFSGGDVHEMVIGSSATVTISGGSIEEIYSFQGAWTQGGYPNPHITMVCDVDSVFHDIDTNILTGNWLDGSGFNIQLVDVDGYSPVIENIQFIPEPVTILLLGIGGLLLRKKR